ncbi:hypothetical protein BDZ45DRAFT_742643 [Acephala macrosclerotiorum]|nr:hypothetical protein BDZ45DRAFT_742643 [Acephala macrosclerotiorum]
MKIPLIISPLLALNILRHSRAQEQQLPFMGFYWVAPANIVRFECTIITPSDPTTINNAAIWPGLQESPTLLLPQNSVLQNVISAEAAAQWLYQPEYCCDPDIRLAPGYTVYSGDIIKSVFTKDIWSGIWTDSVWITRGPEALAQGWSDFSGSLQFDPKQHGMGHGPYQEAVIAVEPHLGFKWDFGEVVFQDILIEAQTTETKLV